MYLSRETGDGTMKRTSDTSTIGPTIPGKHEEPTESGNTAPWLADNQSLDLNIEFWLVVYLSRSVPDKQYKLKQQHFIAGEKEI